MRGADESVLHGAPRPRPSADQLQDPVAQLRGWRLCWELAVAGGDLKAAQRLADTLTAWLRVRSEAPDAQPDIVAVAAALARRRAAGRGRPRPVDGRDCA